MRTYEQNSCDSPMFVFPNASLDIVFAGLLFQDGAGNSKKGYCVIKFIIGISDQTINYVVSRNHAKLTCVLGHSHVAVKTKR